MKFPLIPCQSPVRRALWVVPFALLVAFAGGCASPRPPRPPTLDLPEPVKDLTADRIGDVVRLHWTTPTNTTDKIAVKGAMTADICRINVAPAPPAPACISVQRLPVTPGPSQATDSLPPSLTVDPPALLAYRIQILNAHGHSAGPSPQVFAATGAAPPPVEQLHATVTRDGAMLEWKPQQQFRRRRARPPPHRTQRRRHPAHTAQARSEVIFKARKQKIDANRPNLEAAPSTRFTPEATLRRPTGPNRGQAARQGRSHRSSYRPRRNHRFHGHQRPNLPVHRPASPLRHPQRPRPGAAQLHLAPSHGSDARRLPPSGPLRPRSSPRRSHRSRPLHRSFLDSQFGTRPRGIFCVSSRDSFRRRSHGYNDALEHNPGRRSCLPRSNRYAGSPVRLSCHCRRHCGQ